MTSYRLLLLATAILFSTGGAVIKAASLTSWQVASFRSAVAALTLLVLLPAARRGWRWRVWPVGATYAGTLVFFVLSNRLTTGANAIFLQSTGPLYMLLLSPWLLHERIRRRDASDTKDRSIGRSTWVGRFTITLSDLDGCIGYTSRAILNIIK